ncbi:Serine/threonine-protein kinase wnk3 [Sarracenia purpurea var. burkii]
MTDGLRSSDGRRWSKAPSVGLYKGPDASIAELTDFICASQISKATDAYLQELPDENKVFFCMFPLQ